jgi:hypothetical protein
MKKRRFIRVIAACATALPAGRRCGAQAISIITCADSVSVSAGVLIGPPLVTSEASQSPNYSVRAAVATADIGTLTGSFPASLSDTNLDAAQFELAGGLRDASLTLINPAMLPGGQFRFDLPTEPSYAYTVQFTQTPGDPASWTPIFTNIATTALLSFINAVPAGAQAGFYQATHN